MWEQCAKKAGVEWSMESHVLSVQTFQGVCVQRAGCVGVGEGEGVLSKECRMCKRSCKVWDSCVFQCLQCGIYSVSKVYRICTQVV